MNNFVPDNDSPSVENIRTIAKKVAAARYTLAACTEEKKNKALNSVKEALEQKKELIFAANKKDMENAADLEIPLKKRLAFGEDKLKSVLDGLDSLITLPDPVGRVISARGLDQGLELYQVSCPLGVIAMIFESRPDALVQIASLALKSGNGVLLKGGREAMASNRALAAIIHDAGVEAGLPESWLGLVETREEVAELLKLDDIIDLLIPRGSNEFVRYIMDNTSIPVLGHADGICHVYVASDISNPEDLKMAVDITVDSKTQYVAVCNALETLLVSEKAAPDFLPLLKEAMDNKKVILRGCEITRKYITAEPADQQDWSTEYLDNILAVKCVSDLQKAIEHINTYGSGHTDVIVTKSKRDALYFMDLVDSANTFWNCSTRFADGYRYGLGAELGIGTGKIHARGPVGLEGLVIYKWRLFGSGQIVADYTASKENSGVLNTPKRSFSHKNLATEEYRKYQ